MNSPSVAAGPAHEPSPEAGADLAGPHAPRLRDVLLAGLGGGGLGERV